jgi:Protein of unknown function (DUF3638)/Protein of unknown function (DUF3645)
MLASHLLHIYLIQVSHKSHISCRDELIFEAFEASPSAEQTLEAKGAMQWDFPTVAVSLPRETFENKIFQENLASFLQQASLEPIEEFAAKAHKAGVAIAEARDTANPALITDFLMTLLAVNGSRGSPPVLRKRVKDDVCWEDSELPWRRSPFWLVLRVSVQRLLYLTLGEEKGRVQYKFLIAVLLSQLLTHCVHAAFDVELCSFLKAKLCRRLAKLESEMKEAEGLPTYSDLFAHLGPICSDAIDMAASFTETQWNAFKLKSLRKIPALPRWAYDTDLHLTLPKSGQYLRNVFNQSRRVSSTRPPAVDLAILDSNSSKATIQFYSSLLKQYCTLEDRERNIELVAREVPPESQGQCSNKCQQLAKTIRDYIEAVGDAYDGNTEQMSVFILNIFELWVYMDQCAVKVHPLLRQYHPFFEPEMLDILLLSRLHDLERLQVIQKYIHTRCTQAKRPKDIFADSQKDCFADRYWGFGDELNIRNLNRLRDRIETESLKVGEAKKRELQNINAEYEKRTHNITEHTCTRRRNPDGSHNIKGCTHCWHVRSRKRLKIKVHEEYLPRENTQENITQKRVILFELDPPQTFSSYRIATWEIIHCLCPRIQQTKQNKPEMLLGDYPQLASYHNRHDKFSLASATKSFLGTHYNSRYLPADANTILLPLGLRFEYYDSGRGVWAKDIQRPLSFAHHFVLNLPKELPFSTLYSSADFAADGNGPSSYDVIGSTLECPSELTIHEYTAHQNLIAGKNRRWLSILTELGSSNVNFGLQDTMVLFHHLSLQVGPRLENDHPGDRLEHGHLRTVHAVFKDHAFCRKLLYQIEQHVEAISQNWRENYYMETLLTLTIQACTLGHKATFTEAHTILLKIRNVTLTWIKTLRNETRTTKELDVAERSARYGFLAALLCRRTFHLAAYDDTSLDKESLMAFVEATLAMQENLIVDLNRFSTTTLYILIRDIKTAHRLRSSVRHSIHQYPSSLESAIDRFWPKSTDDIREYTSWKFLHAPYEWWVTSTVVATETTMPQVVHYHLLEGHLLIDGKALGKLPASIRDSEILKDLFGNQRLVSFPSNLPGMSYMLSISKEDYKIHLGHRGQELVVQASKGRECLEYIPSHIFENEASFDLPGSLIDGCVHWLNLRSGNIEVRRKPKIWIPTPGNWILNLRESQGRRKNSHLVNPQSETFRLVSQVFQNFAPARALTVFQPEKGTLSVEIKSMDLSFYVNQKRSLLCQQLASEIDPDQDAGTLYGFKSMIVLRDVKNPSRRSVLTTLGHLTYYRSGVHVEVKMENDGTYAKYFIDSVLGRLHCPPEPRLLYNKARVHALTSFVIPDPLTGRTGTEEALRCLQSGMCKPWNPLINPLVVMLQNIASLTPRRHYYPKNLRRQQRVSWDPNLTMTIQHDAYQGIVDSIVNKSQRLWLFHMNAAAPGIDDREPTSQHLCERAHWRRSTYERPDTFSSGESVPDFAYNARGKWAKSGRVSNVREILTLLRRRPASIHTTPHLGDILREWPIIGGYKGKFVPYSISDCLKMDLAQEWGGLVSSQIESEEAYNIIFLLGLMAFSEGIDMRILRTLVAFFLLDDLKRLDLPKFSSLSGLDMDQKPSLEELINIIQPFCQEYQKPSLPRRQKDRDEALRLYEAGLQLHEHQCLQETTSFAKFLLQQWPTRAPSVEEFEEELLEKDEALDAITPRWQQLYDALVFSNHISEVQNVLNHHYVDRNETEPIVIPKFKEIYGLNKDYSTVIPRLSQVLSARRKGVVFEKSRQSHKLALRPSQSLAEAAAPHTSQKPKLTAEITELEDIIAPFVSSDFHVRSSYGLDLARSINAFKCVVDKDDTTNSQVNIDLNGDILRAQETINRYRGRFRDSLSFEDARCSWLDRANLWPSMGPISILEQLRSNSIWDFDENTKHELIDYATAIAKLQHLNRMRDAVLKNDHTRLRQEQANPGHGKWNPSTYPDWLLFEIDSDIYIRDDQVTVALEMISPTSGSNSVLQMNMGQGKTSVIMPIVACSLANKQMLTRLLVPNALLSQTAQILQSRLGGLVGREVTHVPFSRRTPTTKQRIKEYLRLHGEMLDSGGIILAIPDHALSFKLCGLQRVSDGKISEAKQMIAIQNWMDKVCRDILDECDFTLATKTQLVYPSGEQLTVDGHPYRWKVTQTVLSLVSNHLRDLAIEFPRSIDVIERGISAFPLAHILRNDVEYALIQRIVDDICAGRTSILPIREFTQEEQQAIREFISQEDVEQSTAEMVIRLFANAAPLIRKNVYLLRGLFVHGILLLCLKKRWNVQYGLHPKRDPVAVPFHAKGVPSEQAEWGHPDVAILFTCLAFYHHGLEQKQVRQSLQVVLKSDDPATEYDQWIQTSTTLPDALRHWNIINMDDEGQIEKIWLHLRFSTVVVNHFLNHFVFPAHAKQFSIKLQASGWDVPLFSLNSNITGEGPGITTGFSGTNDNKRLLPLTVEQQDLPRLLHTNAEVLTYLLQKRNRKYMLATDVKGRRLSELNLLGYLKHQEIRILIDAGAFILEMGNKALVQEWLRVDHEPQAAVYFGSDNKPWIQYRAGATAPLLATPFADNLDGCLVYLDEAHTRGTDLKLPAYARGALTLGLNQTKDHTVQGKTSTNH